ncbi:LytTR family DNA-binding domain-containing protein [Rummeliibacillus sp. NPDC094406]|uniref:LytTR family DNA-binding domain-containing protein n=1 Tax=Rummeliibacillus sp. NPDC094406 TaxID=3364511 RepID=UPI00381E61D5
MIQSTEVLAKELAEQYSNLLVDWIPKGASIAIAVGETYIYYEVGAYDILLENGTKFKKGSIADRVIKERKKIETVIEQELLGIPYYGIGYPIDFLGKPAALIVILSPNHPEVKREPYRFITGKEQDQWVPIAIDKISHFESLNKKNWFYANGDQYKINLTLKELARRLPDYFLRIHRSYIINIHAISRITRDFSSNLIIIMKDGIELPVSNSYLNEVKRVLEF